MDLESTEDIPKTPTPSPVLLPGALKSTEDIPKTPTSSPIRLPEAFLKSTDDIHKTPTPSPVLLLGAKSSLELTLNEHLKTSSKLAVFNPTSPPKHHPSPSHSKGSHSSTVCLKSSHHDERESVMPDEFKKPIAPTLNADSKLLLLTKDSIMLGIANAERRSIHKCIQDYQTQSPKARLSHEDRGVGQKKMLLTEDSLDAVMSKTGSAFVLERKNDSGASLSQKTQAGQRQSIVMFDNVVENIDAVSEMQEPPPPKTTESAKHKSNSKSKQSQRGKAKSPAKPKKPVDPYPHEYNTEEKILALVDVLKTDVNLLRLFTPCSQ